MLAYVDDLLTVSTTEKGFEYVHEALSSVLKVKVTGRLIEDGQMEFLGRLIRWDGRQIMLGAKPEYVKSVFTSFGWDISTVKASLTTPDIRSMYDEESVEEPSKELSSEAASRFRSCLGKIGRLCQTRSDITYFHSMLSRGQSMPRQVHEDALRKFLRWLAAFPLLDQIFSLGDSNDEGENAEAHLVAYCDSNWGSEISVSRKSTSGGVIYIATAAQELWYCTQLSGGRAICNCRGSQRGGRACATCSPCVGHPPQATSGVYRQFFSPPNCQYGGATSAHAAYRPEVVLYTRRLTAVATW